MNPARSGPKLRAVIWDVDGTLAETERDGHRIAFNEAFEEIGLPWRWDVARYGTLLRVAGGFERLLEDMRCHPDAPNDPAERASLARRIHDLKDARYRRLLAQRAIPLRPGVARLFDACREADIALAIATTTSRTNVEALLEAALGPEGTARFAAIVGAEDAPAKKPDPLAYRMVLDALGLTPEEVLAIEDSPNGLASARAAGIGVLITRSVYFAGDGFDGSAAICDDLDTWEHGPAQAVSHIDVETLRDIHRRWTWRTTR